jgi:hypothetical protein
MLATMGSIPDSALRDITGDLKARLLRTVADRDNLLAQIKAMEEDIQLYERLIEREETRQKPVTRVVPKPPSDALANFVFKALLMRPQNKEDLRHSAVSAGYDVDGRSIHAITVNLVRTGKIRELSNGVFGVNAEGAAAH